MNRPDNSVARGLLLTLFIISALAGTAPLSAQVAFEPAGNGIDHSIINCIATAGDGTVLIGGSYGVSRLAPGSDRWSFVPIGVDVATLATSPSGTVVAGTDLGTYRSTDNGLTWANAFNVPGMTDFTFPGNDVGFCIDRAGGSPYLYRSTDAGNTWAIYEIPHATGYIPALASTSAGNVYYLSDSGLARSGDNGATWDLVPILNHGLADDLEVTADGVLILSVRSYFGLDTLYESNDDGVSWTPVDTASVVRIESDRNGGYYYIVSDTLYNRGLPFGPKRQSGLYHKKPGEAPEQMFAAPRVSAIGLNGSEVWMGVNYKAYRFDAGNSSWIQMAKGLSAFDVVALAGDGDGRIFAQVPERDRYATGSSACAIYSSTDGGNSWENLINELSNRPIVVDGFGNIYGVFEAVAWKQPSEDLRIPVPLDTIRMSRQNDRRWSLIAPGSYTDIAWNAEAGCIAVGIGNEDGTGDILYSDDSGSTWSSLSESVWVDSTDSKSVQSLEVLSDGTILFSAYADNPATPEWDAGVYEVTPRRSVRKLFDSLLVTDFHVRTDGRVIAAGQYALHTANSRNGIYEANADMDDWKLLKGAYYVMRKVVPIGSEYLLAWGDSYGDSYVSSDGGHTWTKAILPSLTTLHYAVLLDDWSQLGVTNDDVMQSTDGGLTWTTLLSTGFDGVLTTPLLTRSGYLFAGTSGSGIYRSAAKISAVPEASLRSNSPERISLIGSGPERTVDVDLQEGGRLTLELVDILGRHVSTIASGNGRPGTHQFTLQTDGLATGTYLVVLKTPRGVSSIAFELP